MRVFTPIPGNENDYSGCTPQQLYVEPKYNSYKEEILSHLNVQFYKKLVLTKADIYWTSKAVRELQPNHYCELGLFYYDIKPFKGSGDEEYKEIKKDHIMSLILYCDFDGYCSKFSSTFRQLSITESVEAVRKRNSAFWFQSKFLREAIEFYGTNGTGERGPFYSGVDRVLAIPQFAIRLC